VDLYNVHGKEARLILMDIKMPFMNGLEATKIIRDCDKDIPIVVQTAYAFALDREEAMNVGATDVLVKPITLSALRNTVTRFIPEVMW
ncbi:MAG: response regulator, partial [Bacteroidaceae bacterium]|nr:response regulator [Bacteroidaceae bacterium]